MDKCCDGSLPEKHPPDSCCPTRPACGSGKENSPVHAGPLARFDRMIENCLAYAQQAKSAGLPIVGILCEYTPREVILAAGGVPVCLCGGSASTIPAAEEDLPANLCPLIKSTYGYHALGSNPFLEMADLVVAETTCDGKKKMYELMAEARPMHILELPQKQADEVSRAAWGNEVARLREALQERFSCEITNTALEEAIRLMNHERKLRRQLAALMKADPPPLDGRELLLLKSSVSGIPCDLAAYEEAFTFLKEQGGREDLKGKVRVLLTGVPIPHGAERVMDLIESSGGVVVAMENCTGVKPILEDVAENSADPIRAIADKYYHLPCSVMTRNDDRLTLLRDLARDYKVDCVIELIWQACLTYDVESRRVRGLVEEELGLPYLRIETDYSPSDSARITVRIQALLEMVQTHSS